MEARTGGKYKKSAGNGGGRIIRRVMALTVIFIICFTLGFKFALDSSLMKANATVINIAPDDRIQVLIPMGSSTAAIARILADKDIIGSVLFFRILSNFNGYDGSYKSGTHILSKYLTYDEVMRVLASNPAGVRIMIPEGYTVRQIVQKLAGEKLVTEEEFYAATDGHEFDYSFIAGIPRKQNRLEGYLFPDTYEFDLSAGSEQIIKRMLDNFDSKFSTKYYEQAKMYNMTADQAVILASLIEKETAYPSEMAVISGIIHNRLNHKNGSSTKLEMAATVKYIYNDILKTGITAVDDSNKWVDNPYNTFIYEGLPPGPVCNPGKAAMEAALNPVDTDYLYFVMKPDGTHYFSKTLEEHQAATRIYGPKKDTGAAAE